MPKNTVLAAGEAMPTISALFADWQRQMTAATTDEDISAAATIEARMNALKPVTAADFAMKLLVVTGNGDFQPTPQLIEEAMALASATVSREFQPPLCPYNFRSRLLDIEDKLKSLRSLNEAVFMAAFAIGTPAQRDAIQAVANIAEERLESIIEDITPRRKGGCMMHKPMSSDVSIASLFALWQVENRQALNEGLSQAETEATSKAAFAIAAQIANLPPTTAQELAMKFIVHTLAGSLSASDAFTREAANLAGYVREGA
jgi:hypothetical protein